MIQMLFAMAVNWLRGSPHDAAHIQAFMLLGPAGYHRLMRRAVHSPTGQASIAVRRSERLFGLLALTYEAVLVATKAE
jgi:hypothetical protein